ALAILASRESDTLEVRNLYTQYLRRAADPGGLNNFVNALQAGLPNEAVIATLVGSQEFNTVFVLNAGDETIPPTRFNLLDVGSLGGSGTIPMGQGLGINSIGQVTGESFLAGNTVYHAFVSSGGRITDLGTLGGDKSAGQGISFSNTGQVQ